LGGDDNNSYEWHPELEKVVVFPEKEKTCHNSRK
jgi:hypothetical protein